MSWLIACTTCTLKTNHKILDKSLPVAKNGPSWQMQISVNGVNVIESGMNHDMQNTARSRFLCWSVGVEYLLGCFLDSNDARILQSANFHTRPGLKCLNRCNMVRRKVSRQRAQCLKRILLMRFCNRDKQNLSDFI